MPSAPTDPPSPPSAAPRVLCFGEALVDRLVPPGEDRLGGAPANVACGLARLGTPAAFLGRLGRDAIGRSFAALFGQRGVDTSALQWDPGRPSRIVLVQRDAGGDRSFGGFDGDRGLGFADQAVEEGPLLQAFEPLAAEARWLLCGTLALASPAAAAALEALVAAALDRGVALAVDVNWRPTFWGLGAGAPPPPQALDRIRPLLERASLLKCAAEEAEALFGCLDPVVIRAGLPRRPAVLITDGERPLRWTLGETSGIQPAFPVEVVDTTGAGDAFTGGLLHGLCRPDATGPLSDPAELIRFASACGALVCRGAGAIDPQPEPAGVATFLMERNQGA